MADARARLDDATVAAALGALEDLFDRLEQVPGPTAEAGLDAIAALSDVYGEALARVVDSVDPSVLETLAADGLVGHLLLLHGLHPEPVTIRVARAAAEASAELGGTPVEVVTVVDGVARLRVSGAGCPSSAPALLDAIGAVVLAAAPELVAVEPEAATRPAPVIPAEFLLRHPAGR